MKTLVSKVNHNNCFQYEVEVVLGFLSQNEVSIIEKLIPSCYTIENRSENGWGYVLQTDKKMSNTLNQTVINFLKPLENLVGIIYKHKCLLRIAVYYSTFTCTINIDFGTYLVKFNLTMEITTYPIEQDVNPDNPPKDCK